MTASSMFLNSKTPKFSSLPLKNSFFISREQTKMAAARRFNGSTTAAQVVEGVRLEGCTIAVTGTTNGIGVPTAHALAATGAQVVMFVRNAEAGQRLKQDIEQLQPDAKLHVINELDIVVLNAGVSVTGAQVTEDGYETAFAVNHLSQYYLLRLLLPALTSHSRPKRVVVVASDAHLAARCLPYEARTNGQLNTEDLTLPLADSWNSAFLTYCRSKACNVLAAKALDKRYKTQGIRVNALHPGLIYTNVANDGGWLLWLACRLSYFVSKTPEQGAATTAYVATAPELKDVGGEYLSDCQIGKVRAYVNNERLQDRLITISDQLIDHFESKR